MDRAFSAARFAIDAIVGATVFLGLTLALLGPSAAAQLITTGVAPAPLAASLPADPKSLLIVTTAVFSALFALNLAFMRQIKNAEARARRPSNRRPALTE